MTQPVINPDSFPIDETLIALDGPVGQLECIAMTPENKQGCTAIICHPHPLFEGTMHNKVVYILSRLFHSLGIATVRFNYRGVGASAGEYGDVEGELDDCRAIVDWVREVNPEDNLCFAGFSFGSYIAAKIATEHDTTVLVSIAPPVHHMPFDKLPEISCPWVVVQGDTDEVVPPLDVYTWQSTRADIDAFLTLKNAGHFFHGRLTELRAQVERELRDRL